MNTHLSIDQSMITGKIPAPPSKSYSHRAIVVASLSNKSEISHLLLSEDVKATISASRSIGADVRVSESGDHLTIRGVLRPVVPDDVINVLNSGTTLRFFTAITSLAPGTSVLTGDASIRTRPNDPLLGALRDLGADAFSTKGDGTAPIVVRGPLVGGNTKISGSISSQFISALLIACPLAEENSTILIEGELKSRPYVDVTLEVLHEAGIAIDERDDPDGLRFVIEGNQAFDLRRYTVPGDFSSSSYLLAAGALSGDRVTIQNLYQSAQGDSAIIRILEEMGADIVWNREAGKVTVSKSDLHGITVDVGRTPDLVPTLAVLGACASGEMRITNASHVRYKETDRLHAMAVELAKMGVSIVEKEDELVIRGGEIQGASLHGWDDHRIVMALAVAGMVAGDTEIDTAESVAVSYPGFVRDMRRLGGGIREIL
ncbi:MAG TPA: 3-phosphoshikimate 1-carboxyvinyltransferase [Methanosarcinales archaeon]|nr:3-phosphoshikimate 1-carboxyvinyltransferase [Methanosarcinales archaeon]